MYSFGPASLLHLNTCHPNLIRLAQAAIAVSPYDFSITEGHRSLERQAELFRQGFTHIDGKGEPGKHNLTPAEAFDFMPYPALIDGISVWEEGRWRFHVIAGVIFAVANLRSIRLRWGGDWGQKALKSNFIDLPHIELLRPN